MNIIDNNDINQQEQIYSIVENGYNTCYIDSVLICLFYKNDMHFLLEEKPRKPEGYYLQELIKNKFINPIQRNYYINSNTINEIRNYSVICGWSSDGNITDQKNCNEYICFILDLFNSKPIQFEIFEISNNIITDNTEYLTLPYINLIPQKDDTIHNLLQYWINSKIYSPNDNIIKCYKLIQIPRFIMCYIDRFNNTHIKNNYKIDIMKRIKFFNINDQTQKYIKWKIHGIICHKDGNSLNCGHYYTICTTTDKNRWLLFDDNLIPSFQEINLKDDDIKEKIMTDVIIIIYVIDE